MFHNPQTLHLFCSFPMLTRAIWLCPHPSSFFRTELESARDAVLFYQITRIQVPACQHIFLSLVTAAAHACQITDATAPALQSHYGWTCTSALFLLDQRHGGE